MKSKFSYKSKRTIIIAAIITVLLAGTATGVYFFTKGNAQAQAAGDNNTTQEQYGEAPEENKNEQQNNTTENEQNKNEQGETTPNQQEEQETERQEQTTNNNQTTQNEQTTTTTTGEVPNQEYVTEREETVKNPWESLEVGWGPTQFASIASTANLTAKKSNLEIHKTVDKKSVKIGDTLTYTISVKNNGDKVAKAIIYDNVPEGTVLLNKDNNEDENTKKLTWRVTVEPGETENVEFTVRVKAEKGTIKNSAIVNGKTTNETETGIINITGKKEVNTSEAKVGDTLTYTIILTNSGNADGTVTVTDEIPTGTRIKDEDTTGYNKATNTMIWSNVEVKAGKSVELTLEVEVKDDTTDTVKNVAKIDNKEIPEKPETKVANITGTKTVDKTEAKVGDTLTYTIALTNNGNADGTVTVTDEIPTGTTLVADSITANGSYNEENKTITWTDVKVEAGKTAEVSFKVTINNDTKTSVTNKAVIDGNKPTEEVETKVANITGTKTVDKTETKVGDTLTYTITLTNSGNADGMVTVTDEIPTGTTLVADSITANGSYNEENKTITWTDVKVEAGKTAEVSFKVTINNDTKTSVTNKAVIDGNKPTEEVETKVANITGTKTVDKTETKVGDTLTYTITLTNSGNADGMVTVTDEIPTGTTLVADSITANGSYNEENKTITWTDVKVEAGKTAEVSFKAIINSDTKTSVTNKAVIDGNKPTEEVETKIANITGAKSVDKSTAKVGDTLTYTITLTNSGNADGMVIVTDEIPTGTTLVADSITANGSYNEENKTITWTDVKVEAGKTAEVSFKVTINNDTKTSVTNKAVIDGNKPTEEVETRIANITGAKSVDKSTAKVGDTLTYTITLTNNGNADGMVTVTDEIPTGTTLVADSITANGSYNEENKTITWTDVKVEAGKTAEVSFKVTINNDTKTSVTNKAVIDGNKPTEEVETKIANITGAKSVDKSTAKVGDTLTYTITLTNNGNADGMVTVTDEIPTGTTLVADSITANGSYNEENKTITWTDVKVEAGKTAEVSFKVTINNDTKTSVTNKAVIDGNKPTEEVETKIANITGAKSVDKSTAKVGDTLTYTITLTNNGNADGTVTVTDEIPTGTRIKDEDTTGYNKATNTMIWSNVEVKAGKSVELTLEVVVKDDTTDTVKNVAKIDNKEIPEKPETKVANITGTKTVDKTEAKVGDTLTYTIKLTNSGNGDGKVTVTDEIPTGTRIKDENTTGYNKETNTMTWSNVEVKANGGTATLTLEVVVKDNTTDTVKNVAKIDNKEIPEKPETKVANITGAKSVDKPTAKVGDTLTYTIKLTNSGNADGKVTVTDEIPTGTRIKDENTTGYNKETNTMTWSNVEVKANGGTATLTLEVVVEDNISIIKNIAYIDGNKIPEEPATSVRHHYTVEHYTENLDGKYSKVEKDTVVSEDVEIGTKVSYENNNYEGFTFDDSKTENKDATVPDNNNLVVKLYYTRRNDLSYTVYYKEQGTETKLADAKVVNNKTFEEKITASIKAEDNTTEKPKPIDGYECVEVKPGTLLIGTGENVITFYYVKLCQYKIEYYLNGNLAEQYTVGPEKIRVGTTIGFETKTEELEKIDSAISGYKYIKYVGVDGKDNEGTTAYKDMNVIKVYYGLPVTSIEKTATEFVNAGDEIEYTIEVSNTGDWKTTITVTDTLEETEYVNGSSNITPSIDGKTLSWSIELEARGSKTISFRAKTNNESYGDEISNTAKIKGTNKEDTAVTRVNEIDVTYSEWLEGQKGTDLNIVFVLDNSSSMNFPIAGKTYVKDELNRKGSHVTPIAPSDKDKTRIENAKSAINSFIDSQANNKNTTMEVVTFNKSEKGTAKNMMTLMDIPDKDIQYRENLWGGYYYIEINGIECRVEKDVIGTDGKKHCGVYIPIDYGARLVGDNSVSNDILKKNVSEISISSEQNGFGTYVEPAFKLINDNKEKQYLKDGKKNIIIVLADGKFSDNNSYNGELKTLKDTLETNGGEIYCVGFGSGTEYDSTALANMSTNNKCYEAKDASTLLTKFNEILASVGKTQSGRTQNGKITFEEAKNTIKVSEECPIVATYGDSENETVLFTCTSDNADEMWNKYGLKIDGKIISWDAKQFAIANEGIKVPNNIKIKYYIARQ